MKTQDRLKKIEAANLPALRLADVKSLGEVDGEFLASVLCALAERGATWPACDELRAMDKRHSARIDALSDTELTTATENEPSYVFQWSGGYLLAYFLWDVFRWMPAQWRPPGAEARLLAEFEAWAHDTAEFVGKSKTDIRAMLNQTCDRLAQERNEADKKPT